MFNYTLVLLTNLLCLIIEHSDVGHRNERKMLVNNDNNDYNSNNKRSMLLNIFKYVLCAFVGL
jgi:hypothetical protein